MQETAMSCDVSPVASEVYELINPTSRVLSDHIIPLPGRPQACDFVESITLKGLNLADQFIPEI